jgi:alanyl-tRNA synthetase
MSKVLTAAEIRQSFLDFFHARRHTLVPSSSLLPDSPNLLFTNAGMNQFVPIFLGQKAPDVSKWAGATPAADTRAADTQKCIRAGGKHNDLEDVGLDTYHHTFFEMLGNWSFGDYFKRESLRWGWELLTQVWRFPPARLYATVYKPDPSKGDPADFDQEAYDIWAEIFTEAGLDPSVHIVYGNKKDNFWMMGDTGPCGPCSEIHVDLTPAGDTQGRLVNGSDARCIEIWNHVFIQFNANPDGTFSPLPAKHVDTGMGFERVCSIIQGTKGFTDFAHAQISNYNTDIFRPIFDELEKLSGKTYTNTLPKAGSTGDTEQEKIDVAFRVIADHLRTLTFAVADGINPGNSERHYVLRRILRRAVKYGRTLGFTQPFFYQLPDVLARTMGDVFPEVRAKLEHVKNVLRTEEEAFNRTLDRGMEEFELSLHVLVSEHVLYHTAANGRFGTVVKSGEFRSSSADTEHLPTIIFDTKQEISGKFKEMAIPLPIFKGADAFKLYDTYGFPLDLTQLLARERGLEVDGEGFEVLMEQQRARARAAQKKTVIELSQIETTTPTKFVGYDNLVAPAKVIEVVGLKDKTAVVLDASVCYAEMGGQVGDTGELLLGGNLWRVVDTRKNGDTWLHLVEGGDAPEVGQTVELRVDAERRRAIERHHTVTHLLHWALHEVVSPELGQKGSAVGPEKLSFDFNSAVLTAQQVAEVEKLVNARILENAGVSWTEVPHAAVKSRKDVMQFFGDKYGETVRVVQIGGRAGALDGYSMELCGGTHTRATGELGLFRILSEGAVAAGVRRIEAVAGLKAWEVAHGDGDRLRSLALRLSCPLTEVEKRIEGALAHTRELEKALKAAQQREAAGRAQTLLGLVRTRAGLPVIAEILPDLDGDALQGVAEQVKDRFQGVLVLASSAAGAVSLVASVHKDFTGRVQAGKIIQTLAPQLGGKGGGRPEFARGSGKDAAKLAEVFAGIDAVLADLVK